jgi:hypothetical protein
LLEDFPGLRMRELVDIPRKEFGFGARRQRQLPDCKQKPIKTKRRATEE